MGICGERSAGRRIERLSDRRRRRRRRRVEGLSCVMDMAGWSIVATNYSRVGTRVAVEVRASKQKLVSWHGEGCPLEAVLVLLGKVVVLVGIVPVRQARLRRQRHHVALREAAQGEVRGDRVGTLVALLLQGAAAPQATRVIIILGRNGDTGPALATEVAGGRRGAFATSGLLNLWIVGSPASSPLFVAWTVVLFIFTGIVFVFFILIFILEVFAIRVFLDGTGLLGQVLKKGVDKSHLIQVSVGQSPPECGCRGEWCVGLAKRKGLAVARPCAHIRRGTSRIEPGFHFAVVVSVLLGRRKSKDEGF